MCLLFDGSWTQGTLFVQTGKWQRIEKACLSKLFTAFMFESFSSYNRDMKILQQTHVRLLLLARNLFIKSLLYNNGSSEYS